MAEWLRRLTRNQLGSARVGSNPTGVDLFRTSSGAIGLIPSAPLKVQILLVSFYFRTSSGSKPTGVDNLGNFQHFSAAFCLLRRGVGSSPAGTNKVVL